MASLSSSVPVSRTPSPEAFAPDKRQDAARKRRSWASGRTDVSGDASYFTTASWTSLKDRPTRSEATTAYHTPQYPSREGSPLLRPTQNVPQYQATSTPAPSVSRAPSLAPSLLEAAQIAAQVGGPEPLGLHPQQAKKIFWSTTLLFGCYGVAWGSWRALIPSLKEELDASVLAFGGILAVSVGAYLASSTLHQRMERHLRIPGITTLASVSFPIALGSMAQARSVPQAIGAMAIAGVLSELMGHGITHTGDRLTYEGYPRANSLAHTVFSGGELVGGVFSAAASYREVTASEHLMQVGLAMGLLGGMIGVWGYRELPAGLHKPVLGLRGDKVAMCVAALGLISAVGKAAVANWVGIYLREHLHASKTEASLGYVAFSAASFMGDLSASHLVAATTSRYLMTAEALAVPVGIFFGLGLGGIWSAFVGAATAGMGLGVFRPATAQAAGKAAAIENKVALGFLTNFQSAGYMFGNLLVGFAAQHIGIGTGLGLIVVPGLAKLVLTHQLSQALDDLEHRVDVVEGQGQRLAHRVETLAAPIH